MTATRPAPTDRRQTTTGQPSRSSRSGLRPPLTCTTTSAAPTPVVMSDSQPSGGQPLVRIWPPGRPHSHGRADHPGDRHRLPHRTPRPPPQANRAVAASATGQPLPHGPKHSHMALRSPFLTGAPGTEEPTTRAQRRQHDCRGPTRRPVRAHRQRRVRAHFPWRATGGQARDGDRRRLLEAEVGRLGGEPVRSGAGVLGEGAVAGAEHLVTRVAPGRVGADRLHAPGDIPYPAHGSWACAARSP